MSVSGRANAVAMKDLLRPKRPVRIIAIDEISVSCTRNPNSLALTTQKQGEADEELRVFGDERIVRFRGGSLPDFV